MVAGRYVAEEEPSYLGDKGRRPALAVSAPTRLLTASASRTPLNPCLGGELKAEPREIAIANLFGKLTQILLKRTSQDRYIDVFLPLYINGRRSARNTAFVEME